MQQIKSIEKDIEHKQKQYKQLNIKERVNLKYNCSFLALNCNKLYKN